jgi:hypothetical protein
VQRGGDGGVAGREPEPVCEGVLDGPRSTDDGPIGGKSFSKPGGSVGREVLHALIGRDATGCSDAQIVILQEPDSSQVARQHILQLDEDCVQHVFQNDVGCEEPSYLTQAVSDLAPPPLRAVQVGVPHGDGHAVGQSLEQEAVVFAERNRPVILNVQDPKYLIAKPERHGELGIDGSRW